ncbi:MAG: endonuclease III [Ignavibacteriaceae bacterium]|jgi:endonuclease-3|nr:endonuclease III [Ignavibacteriaceae bacterium]
MTKKIEKINKLLIEHFGVPAKAKKLPDPLDTIIGTILSQNTNDNNSYKAYRNLKVNFNNWDELALLKPSQIEKYIKVAGLGKQKSKAIYELLKNLKRKQSKVSLKHIKNDSSENILEELTSYKGVGVKTASCVLLFSLDRNICPVDTHVHRTLNRIGLVKTSSPEKTFFALLNKLPEGTAHSFHTNLIKLGREICKAQKPICSVCPLVKICKYENKNFEMVSLKRTNNFMLLDNLS